MLSFGRSAQINKTSNSISTLFSRGQTNLNSIIAHLVTFFPSFKFGWSTSGPKKLCFPDPNTHHPRFMASLMVALAACGVVVRLGSTRAEDLAAGSWKIENANQASAHHQQ